MKLYPALEGELNLQAQRARPLVEDGLTISGSQGIGLPVGVWTGILPKPCGCGSGRNEHSALVVHQPKVVEVVHQREVIPAKRCSRRSRCGGGRCITTRQRAVVQRDGGVLIEEIEHVEGDANR